MYPRNAASPERIAIGAVVQISDGAVQASGVSVKVLPIGTTASAGGGTIAYEEGIVYYLPTQAETNYTSFILIAYKTGCIPASVTVVTTASATPGTVLLAPVTHTSAVVPTVSTLTGHTAQTGDSFARLGAPAGASVSADVAAVKTQTAAIEVDTQDIQSRIPAALVSGRMDSSTGAMAANVMTAAAAASDLTTELQSGLATAAALATVDTVVDGLATTLGSAGAGLTAVPWNAAWDAEVQSEVQDAIEANHLDHLLAVTYDPASKPGAADALLNELVESDAGVARFTANALEQGPSGGGGVADWTADERTAIRSILGIPASGTTPDDPTTGILDTIRDAVLTVDTVVDGLATTIGAAGAGLTEAGGTGDHLTALPWNAAWDAEVQSEVADGLTAYGAATATDVTTAAANVSVDEIQATALADLFNTNSGTTYASAVAGSVVAEIADNAGGSALTAAAIADAVWDEALAGHVASGSTGEALNAAGGAGDPWITALPGSYSAGQAGYIVGTYLDAEVAAIKAKTDLIPASPAAVSDIPTATQNADALLNRDMSAVSDTNARSPLNALRFIRNKWSISGTTLTVTKEDDSTGAWTATVSTNASAEPVVGNDPA